MSHWQKCLCHVYLRSLLVIRQNDWVLFFPIFSLSFHCSTILYSSCYYFLAILSKSIPIRNAFLLELFVHQNKNWFPRTCSITKNTNAGVNSRGLFTLWLHNMYTNLNLKCVNITSFFYHFYYFFYILFFALKQYINLTM